MFIHHPTSKCGLPRQYLAYCLIVLTAQADKTAAQRHDETTTDKLISDYLLRHSGANAKPARQSTVRQPLAALENLQEALSDLQIQVAYDLSRSGTADNQPGNRSFKTQAATSGSGLLNSRGQTGQPQSKASSPVRVHAAERRAARLQSYPIQCSPIPDIPCVSRLNDNDDTQHSSCRLFSHASILALPADLAAAAADLLTRMQPVDGRLPKHAEQSDVCTKHGSSFSVQGVPTGDLVAHQPEPLVQTPAPSAAAPMPACEASPTVYSTPHVAPAIHADQALSDQVLSPGIDTRWYTPMSSGSLEADTQTATGLQDSWADRQHQQALVNSPMHYPSRADSPSLLYGRGSAFHADTLDVANDLSNQWLCQ